MKNSTGDSEVMLKLGDEMDISYTLIAKAILEKCYEQDASSGSTGNKSQNIKQYLKDATLIKEQDLAYEVFLVS